jgi:hypothetical protein
MTSNLLRVLAFTVIAIAAACASSVITVANAQIGRPSQNQIDQRQSNQVRRIQQGAQSGQLTPHEQARVNRLQARIQRMESRAMADGIATPRENRRIARSQNKASRQIYRQKHDRQQARSVVPR